MKNFFNVKTLDNTGICVSLACAIHCLAMPILITVLPLIGLSFLTTETGELVIIGSAVLISIVSLTVGHNQHKQVHAFLFLISALCLISVLKIGLLESVEIIAHVFIGILIAGSHFMNRYLCSKCEKC